MSKNASLNEKAEEQLNNQAQELEVVAPEVKDQVAAAQEVGTQQVAAVAPPVQAGEKLLIDSAGRPAQLNRDVQVATPTSAASNDTQVPGGRYKKGNSIYNAWGEKIG